MRDEHYQTAECYIEALIERYGAVSSFREFATEKLPLIADKIRENENTRSIDRLSSGHYSFPYLDWLLIEQIDPEFPWSDVFSDQQKKDFAVRGLMGLSSWALMMKTLNL